MTPKDSHLPDELIVSLITLPSLDLAQRLAKSLVDERFAACVTILPQVQSIYWWNGEVCNESEVLCMVKTRRDLFDSMRMHVLTLHPYQVPEVIALPIVLGHAPYLDWVSSETRNPSHP